MTSSPDLFDLGSDITEPDNQTVQGFDPKNQQVADCDSSSSEGEPNGVRESGGGVKMDETGQGGLEEQDDENDEGPLGMEVNLEDEEEDREPEEEEMRDRLCRLVTQARLSYFASTDDELDKVAVTEGDQECGREAIEEQEVEEEDDEEEKVQKRKQPYEQIGDLPFRICQLEREVRASQFSSTEDELDRAGADDDEAGTGDGGVREELAVKVCRLASQVNATQFSSTEDELDRAGRDEGEEEEAMDEETLWKLRAEKAIQAAQLRDLSCLVSPSQFPSSEGLKMDEETESQNGAKHDSSVWKRTESLEDLDVGMFDLRVETEERLKESGDEKLEEEKEKKKVTEKSGGQSLEETVCRDTEREKETEMVARRDKELGREEAEATQEDFCDGKESLDSRAGDSDEEDEEFNRIISSMLMMTLEDMQGAVFDGDNTEDFGKQERAATDEEAGAEWRPDGQITSNIVSEEAGGFEQSKSRGRRTKPAEVKDGGERDSGDVDRQRQSDGNRGKAEVGRHLSGETAFLAESEENLGRGRDNDGEHQAPGNVPADGEDDFCQGEDEERRSAEAEGKNETSYRESLLSPQEMRIVRPSIVTPTKGPVGQVCPRLEEMKLVSSVLPFY